MTITQRMYDKEPDYLRAVDAALRQYDAARNAPMVFTDEEAAEDINAQAAPPAPPRPFPRAETPQWLVNGEMPPGREGAGSEPTFEMPSEDAAPDMVIAPEEVAAFEAANSPPAEPANFEPMFRAAPMQPDGANLDLRGMRGFAASESAEKEAQIALEQMANLAPGETWRRPGAPASTGGMLPEGALDADIQQLLAERKKFEGVDTQRVNARRAAEAERDRRRAVANSQYQHATGEHRRAVVEWINAPMAELAQAESEDAALAEEGQIATARKQVTSPTSDISRAAQDSFLRRMQDAGSEVDEEEIRRAPATSLPDPAGSLAALLERAEALRAFEDEQRARNEAEWYGMPRNAWEARALRDRGAPGDEDEDAGIAQPSRRRGRRGARPIEPTLENIAQAQQGSPGAAPGAAGYREEPSDEGAVTRNFWRHRFGDSITPEIEGQISRLTGVPSTEQGRIESQLGAHLDDARTERTTRETRVSQYGAAVSDAQQLARAARRAASMFATASDAEIVWARAGGDMASLPSGLVPERAQELAAAYAAFRNPMIAERSGSAVSDQEFNRFTSEFAGALTGSPEVMRRELARAAREADTLVANVRARYPQQVRDEYERNRQSVASGSARRGPPPPSELSDAQIRRIISRGGNIAPVILREAQRRGIR